MNFFQADVQAGVVLLGDLPPPSLDSRKGIGIAIGAQDRNRPIPDSRRWAGRCHLSQIALMAAAPLAIALGCLAVASRSAIVNRLTADIDRGRRSRVWPAIAVVSLGLVGFAVFAPGGGRDEAYKITLVTCSAL